ncbi:MAG TPA: K(+)-transporting ATPase subunit C [Thermoanaerobaculia bacterium]|nr:K(+)-transporting ATPase subunit C [Thermoanaerobaculia bacterium]
MKEHILISLRMTIVMVVLTCAVYPGVVFAIAQLAFPHQANGSFVSHGSALIGQSFTSERFFHSRPSASNYDATNSGGTNLGPTSKKLRDAVSAATKAYDAQTNVPADAVASSASGLDPHISPENAYAQAPRIARANHLSIDDVRQLIDRHTEHRFLGVFGEPRVNVLLLNLDLVEHR